MEATSLKHENIDDLEARRISKDWTLEGRNQLRDQILSALPGWYSPLAHFLFPGIFGVATVVVCCLLLRDLRSIELVTIPITLLLSNAIEWRAHKHVLHKRGPGPLAMLFERHTPMHHRLYTYETMEIRDWRELSMVLLPWFGIVSILSLQLPLLGLALLLGFRNVALLFMATSMFYTVMYEWMHMAYHLPKDSFIGRRPLIRWLAEHHARHHDPKLMQRWNMNVTVPLWDWLRGTYYRAPGVFVPTRLRASSSEPARAESR